MTRRLSKTGNIFQVEERLNEKGTTCYDITFFNKDGVLIAQNPCLSKEEMESERRSFKDNDGFKERIVIRKTILK